MFSADGAFYALNAFSDDGFYFGVHLGPIVQLFEDVLDLRVAEVEDFLVRGAYETFLKSERHDDALRCIGQAEELETSGISG